MAFSCSQGVWAGHLALWMYRKLPRIRPPTARIVNLHRAVGVAAILLTLPIAYHCALAYGVQTQIGTRVALHSLAGCFFYGVVAAKLLIVRSRRFPGWTLPLAGGTLVTLVAILWYTSALVFRQLQPAVPLTIGWAAPAASARADCRRSPLRSHADSVGAGKPIEAPHARP